MVCNNLKHVSGIVGRSHSCKRCNPRISRTHKNAEGELRIFAFTKLLCTSARRRPAHTRLPCLVHLLYFPHVVASFHGMNTHGLYPSLSSTRRLALQLAPAVVLLVCLALVSQAAADAAEANYNFTYGYKTAANTVSAVNYTDDAGTSLKVCTRRPLPEHLHTNESLCRRTRKVASSGPEIRYASAGILCVRQHHHRNSASCRYRPRL